MFFYKKAKNDILLITLLTIRFDINVIFHFIANLFWVFNFLFYFFKTLNDYEECSVEKSFGSASPFNEDLVCIKEIIV